MKLMVQIYTTGPNDIIDIIVQTGVIGVIGVLSIVPIGRMA